MAIYFDMYSFFEHFYRYLIASVDTWQDRGLQILLIKDTELSDLPASWKTDAVTLPALCSNQTLLADCALVASSTDKDWKKKNVMPF